MLYHAYKPQTILDFLDLKYNTSTTHHSVDVSVTRGFAAKTTDLRTPDFVHIHVNNVPHDLDVLASTLREVVRHSDNITNRVGDVLDNLYPIMQTIRGYACLNTRSPIYQEYHRHHDGEHSAFIFAGAAIDNKGSVNMSLMEFDLIFVRSNITINHSVPTTA